MRKVTQSYPEAFRPVVPVIGARAAVARAQKFAPSP
ncbi:hypothetical protein FAGKG844_250013 [Frankia sp. AgKG'84/4]